MSEGGAGGGGNTGVAPGNQSGPRGKGIGRSAQSGPHGKSGAGSTTTPGGFAPTTSPMATMLANLTGISSLSEPPTAPTAPATSAGVTAAKKAQKVEEQIKAKEERQKEATRVKKGRRATILTSGRGVSDPLGSVARPSATLLGG